MKYGLIYYRDTDNLGDDILSYAGRRFLPKVDYYIDRESMDVFVPEEKEFVAAILNGWYIHYSYAFPPSPYLAPLWIGAHFNKDGTIFGEYNYLDAYAVRYFKQHEPVGCRDHKTMEMLREKGVEGYFSGCLTLTLPKFPDVSPSHEVIFTDVSDEIVSYVNRLDTGRGTVQLTHLLPETERGWEDWQSREMRLESYLRRYQGADLVITRRLHCALPCIALGTPVILVVNQDEDYFDRIESFSSYCTCCSEEDLLSGRMDEAIKNPLPNRRPDRLIEQMEETVRAFVKRMENGEETDALLPETSVYQELYIDRGNSLREAIRILLQRQYSLAMQYKQDMDTMQQVLALAKKITDSGS